MGATETEANRFRRKLDGTETSMPPDYIDAVFDEAEEAYSGYDRNVIFAAALVSGIGDLIIKASKLTDYQQNQSNDKKSQIAKALESIRARFQKELDDLLATADGPAVRWGGIHKKPARLEEYPDA